MASDVSDDRRNPSAKGGGGVVLLRLAAMLKKSETFGRVIAGAEEVHHETLVAR